MASAQNWKGPFPLTRRQMELLQVLHELLDQQGRCPTYEELAAEMDLRSKGCIAALLYSLRDKGWIALDHKRGCDRLRLLHPPPVMPDFDCAVTVLPAGRDYVASHTEGQA